MKAPPAFTKRSLPISQTASHDRFAGLIRFRPLHPPEIALFLPISTVDKTAKLRQDQTGDD
jgi:hypothetical protein